MSGKTKEKILEYYFELKNKYYYTKQNYNEYIQTKNSSSKTEYRTVLTTLMSKEGKIFNKSFIQLKDEEKWRFIPNNTCIEEQNITSIKQFPTVIPEINSPKISIYKKITTCPKFENFYENFTFPGITPIFPPHNSFEKKYSNIEDYINKYKKIKQNNIILQDNK